jgi:ABC-2 type transport system ATP-binding protein
MPPVLEFENIERSYVKGKPVLNGVTFAVGEGEVVGLLGRNGAGKTTLIRIAMGMLFPHAGAVRVFGLCPTKYPVEVKRRIGFVAEDQELPSRSKIGDLIGLYRYLYPRWDEALERDLMSRFDLDRGARIQRLSKGQARQVALLLAVCHRPELLILDEPASGLDPAARREFLETSIQLLNREGTAILFSSHYMSDVERIGARVVLLDQGKVALDTDLDRLREEYCVAMVSRSAATAATLEQIPGCLRVRGAHDDWHAVFEGAPRVVAPRLDSVLGPDSARCVRVPLEEMFIAMVGGER